MTAFSVASTHWVLYNILRIYLYTMPVSIEIAYNISLDGSPDWKVGPDLVRRVDDQPFIKVRSHDMSFIKMLCFNIIDLPSKSGRPSLTQVPGFKRLLALRNSAAHAAAADEVGEDEGNAAALFGGAAPPELRKKARVNASQLADLRAARNGVRSARSW